jgi:hypothetical protein
MTMDCVQVDLQSNGTADELFDHFMRLSATQTLADRYVAALRQRSQEITSVQDKIKINEALEFCWQQYQVLCAYVQIVYSAYIFELYGTESIYLGPESGFEIGHSDKFTQ